MNVLVVAFACGPNGGSEIQVGWESILALASSHKVTVVTHAQWESDIQAVIPLPKPNLRFVFMGGKWVYHPNRFLARLQSWKLYRDWIRLASHEVLRLCRAESFDLGHHVTIATWRSGSPLSSVDIPWVFGPIGGGEHFPSHFYGVLSRQALFFEGLRSLSTFVSSRNPGVLRALRRCSALIASNPETAAFLTHLSGNPRKISVRSQSFFYSERIQQFQALPPKSPPREKLILFAGGQLEGRKGVAIVLHVLKRLQHLEIPFTFHYGGGGPELGHLLRLRDRLGLNPASVHLGELYTGDSYREILNQSHFYVLPSLRESAGLTLAEAMLSGCVPVVIRAGGPGMLVDESCGLAVEATTPDDVVARISTFLERHFRGQESFTTQSLAARNRAIEQLHVDTYLRFIDGVYAEIAGLSEEPPASP